jgi:hypothetical protein
MVVSFAVLPRLLSLPSISGRWCSMIEMEFPGSAQDWMDARSGDTDEWGGRAYVPMGVVVLRTVAGLIEDWAQAFTLGITAIGRAQSLVSFLPAGD